MKREEESSAGSELHIKVLKNRLRIQRFYIFHTGKMVTYRVTLYTHGQILSEKMNNIFLTLIDSENQSSERVLVNKSYLDVSLASERVFSFDVSAKTDLRDIVLVKLEKSWFGNFKLNHWFCKDIIVKTPSGDELKFPCYSWIEDENPRIFREGTARLAQDDSEFLKKKRREQLEFKQREFSWDEENATEGYPKSAGKVPRKIEFDLAKQWEFSNNFIKVYVQNGLDKVRGFFKSWKDVADFKGVLASYKYTDTLETVMRDWREDYMFGYQFLNGCNPVMIRKCMEIPDKFPVTHEMVKGFLERGVTLQEELKAGNIYIVDYVILEGVPTSSDQLYLTAPLCLLYKNRLDHMVPIAIQLSQTPGKESPIFLPSDNEHDWMLAKMWVKSADFLVHQLVTHLLKTHLLSEVFEIAMHRQLPAVHPVYKLLQPHVRFTTAINAKAREQLINEGGVITQITSLNRGGIDRVIKRAMETLSYESLCFPEAIEARGMKDVPKYYYRDDGMKIWEEIHSFVSAVVEIYYDSDAKVHADEEIQGFVKDCHDGMRRSHNFPVSLRTREELIKYLTVVIFTASAQHAAVNFGQFDWYGWIPNSPSTMRKPPPKQKGKVDMKYIMESLPDRGCSRLVVGTVWGLSRFQEEERYLGTYPDMAFTEKPVKEAIETFREKLVEVTKEIKRRNQGLRLEYCYLSPNRIPNSVAI